MQEAFTRLTAYWERDFLQDMAALNVLPPDAVTRVSDYLPEIVAYIEQIMRNGYCYEAITPYPYPYPYPYPLPPTPTPSPTPTPTPTPTLTLTRTRTRTLTLTLTLTLTRTRTRTRTLTLGRPTARCTSTRPPSRRAG